jgi:aquaporin Z
VRLQQVSSTRKPMVGSVSEHWPEYLMEAALFGIYMMAAGFFAVVLQTPLLSIDAWVRSPFVRRLLYGVAMGAVSIGLVYSPWGRRSGAHSNSAITFTFWRLGKIKALDTLFYVMAQFAGGISGVAIIAFLLGDFFRLPPVTYVATQPGAKGIWWALAAEFLMSFLLMSTILSVTNRPALALYTGYFTGFLTTVFLTFEAPLSGMSMNPARTFSPAITAWLWRGTWVYLVGPMTGMLLAVEVRKRLMHAPMDACAKLYHDEHMRCIFCGRDPR